MTQPYWAVAKTKPSRELWAAENIQRQGYEFYLPRFTEMVLHKRQGMIKRTSCLFPSYIFVQIMSEWRFLLSTFGISKVLLDARGPCRLPDHVMERLRQSEDRMGMIELPAPPPGLVYGQKVRVALPGDRFEIGIYQGSGTQEREQVLLNILGQKTRVFIGRDQLEAA